MKKTKSFSFEFLCVIPCERNGKSLTRDLKNQIKNSYKRAVTFWTLMLIFNLGGISLSAQCDTEVSGIYTYCNSFHMGNPVTGYFVAFRVKDLTGATLDIVDLTGQVPDNQGKRINDINTDLEPDDYTVQQLMISGVGADTLEFWYFGPFASGTPFDIAIVDPANVCDTVFIASGSYDCMDNTGISDPGACDADVPLYFLDFSQTEFLYGGGGGGNEDFDEIFLIMARSRENFCCDLQPTNQSCFEFIVRLDDEDIGLSIDDVGSGSPGGELYADTLNLFACTGASATTWPFTQSGGQSQDAPLCLSGESQEYVVLSCKSGSNATAASIDAISNLIAPPEATQEPCEVTLEVLNTDTATWMSNDDPNLDNLVSCAGDSLFCSFLYDTLTFGQVTACEGDTFVYIVSGMPTSSGCFVADTILFDTTYVVVYPVFTVSLDTMCNGTGDSLIMVANVISPAMGCAYDYAWSNGATTSSITVPFNNTEYFVTVTRGDLPVGTAECIIVVDSIVAAGIPTVDCSNITDTLYTCIAPTPLPDTSLVLIGGCSAAPFIYTQDISNGGAGCILDTLIITRYYIIDFDADTINTTADRDTCTQLLKYVDSVAPVITTSAVTSPIECPLLPVFSMATATDVCDATPTLTFSDVTTPGTCPQEYSVTRTWTATDDCGNSSTAAQSISVTDNTAPVLSTLPGPTSVECPTAPSFATPTATDACDGTPSLTFSDVTTAGTCPQEYSVTRTWTATDDCGNSSTTSQTISVTDNVAPVLGTLPGPTSVECPATPSFATPTATDVCDGTPSLTFGDVTTAGTCPQEYSVKRTWTAMDDCGNSSTAFQIISVTDNTAPVLSTLPGPTSIECPATPSFATPTATDACDVTSSLTFSDVNTPGTCPQEYSVTRTWTATDDCGNSSTASQTISVTDNVAPVLGTLPGPTSVECPATPSFTTPTVTDACDMTPSLTFSDATTPGTCPQEYSVTRTWTGTDDCGNSSTASQTISVTDNTAPVLGTLPGPTSVECPATPSFTTPTATDACDGTPSLTFSDVTTAGTCPQEYSVTRTWIATDDCGNSSTASQTISVTDNTAPVLGTLPGPTSVECPATPSFTTPTATDACDGTPSLTFGDVTTAGTCPQEYSVTRTWTATDDCGNSSSTFQTISVTDNTVPMCAAQDITISVDLNLGYVLITPTQINNGSADLCGPVTLSISQDSFTCDDVGLNVVTLTVTDLCGNTSSCTASVTITECYNPCVTIVGWVYLEGSATDPNGLPVYTVPMRTTLNDLQVLPGQTLVDPFFGNKYSLPGQPYDVAPWNYMGNEGDAYDSGGDPNMGDAGYPSTVTDWVLVSLRADSAGTGGPVCQAAALLHNNGYIDFVQPFDCCDLNLLDSFYLVVEHRNHIIVMSHNEVPIVPGVDSSTITYDFRIQQSYVDDPFMFGIFARQKEILPGEFAMFAGNGDQALSAQSDTDITSDDRGIWAAENGDIGEYRMGDYNMNGDTNFGDRVTWERNNGKFTSVPRN